MANTLSANSFSEVGASGLQRFGGYIYEEFLRELKGRKGIQVYREMSENDPAIGAMLFAIKMLIRQTKWPVERFSDDPADVLAAEFLESCFDDMEQPWSDTVAEILSMLTYGWAWHEIVYKIRIGMDQDDKAYRSKFEDGRIGWRKIPLRAQDTLWQWEFDENGEVVAMMQSAPPDYKIRRVPIEKSLLFRTETTKNNPEGRSILRNGYRPWFIKKHVENMEAIGVERDLAGLPVAWIPPDFLEPDAPPERRAILEAVKKIVTNIKRDEQEGLVFPLLYDEKGNKQFDLTLLTTGGRRQFDTSAIVNRYKLDILGTVMADFLMLGHMKVGTFSLTSSKTELFATAIGAWMDSVVEVMNREAIPKLFELNGLPTNRLPKLTHGDIESNDLPELADFIQKLSASGAALFPNPELENYLLKQAGLPTTQDHVPTATGQDVPRETMPDPNAPDPNAPVPDPNAMPIVPLDTTTPVVDPTLQTA